MKAYIYSHWAKYLSFIDDRCHSQEEEGTQQLNFNVWQGQYVWNILVWKVAVL